MSPRVLCPSPIVSFCNRISLATQSTTPSACHVALKWRREDDPTTTESHSRWPVFPIASYTARTIKNIQLGLLHFLDLHCWNILGPPSFIVLPAMPHLRLVHSTKHQTYLPKPVVTMPYDEIIDDIPGVLHFYGKLSVFSVIYQIGTLLQPSYPGNGMLPPTNTSTQTVIYVVDLHSWRRAGGQPALGGKTMREGTVTASYGRL
ncbi:hypothetical protein ARMSODRAFT_1019919 [Armillaria solidipes]|uniref:Uncharacterized protein n=1 Tax=Armillaria solidipes TaxID=1076256 RepID=A0A2H3BFB1_9AGAR|nr:hypothetical protein ARMSODRAFT_1019919 [Armillaria solidipes]